MMNKIRPMVDASGNSRYEVSKRKPKIGAIIGGGGLKCLAAVSLFEFLNDSEIDADLMVVCSWAPLWLHCIEPGTTRHKCVTPSLSRPEERGNPFAYQGILVIIDVFLYLYSA
ncbi:MAG: hypothetical protein JXA01_04220 [Dehalococcoidia bacterium]|nr:hypothetical protein [Dehalococcoidia bacterium]